MFWFVCAIIFLLTTVAVFIFVPKRRTEEDFNFKALGFIPLALALVCLLFSLTAVVGTRNVGVPTVFGKPTGETYGAGLHFKAPWVSVTDIDATIQAEEYKGDDCIYVKIADGGSACISLAYRWRINPDGADTAFMDYRRAEGGVLEGIRKALVSTNIKAAINEELGKYDPLASDVDLTTDMTPAQLANLKINVVPDYEQINADIQTNVEKKIASLGDLIDIASVTVSYVKLPDTTQDRINAFTKAVQDTKIALQDIATKDAQAAANEKLASSLKDPNVLVSKCFDGLISGDIKNEPGFSCWGAGGSVVIPAAK